MSERRVSQGYWSSLAFEGVMLAFFISQGGVFVYAAFCFWTIFQRAIHIMIVERWGVMRHGIYEAGLL